MTVPGGTGRIHRDRHDPRVHLPKKAGNDDIARCRNDSRGTAAGRKGLRPLPGGAVLHLHGSVPRVTRMGCCQRPHYSAVPDVYTDLIGGINYRLHGRISYPLPNDPAFGFFIADINRHIIIGLNGFMAINATLDFPSGSISWKPLPQRFPLSGPTCTRCYRGHVLSRCPIFFCSGKEGTVVIELLILVIGLITPSSAAVPYTFPFFSFLPL